MEKFKNSLQFHILVTYRRYTYIVEKGQLENLVIAKVMTILVSIVWFKFSLKRCWHQWIQFLDLVKVSLDSKPMKIIWYVVSWCLMSYFLSLFSSFPLFIPVATYDKRNCFESTTLLRFHMEIVSDKILSLFRCFPLWSGWFSSGKK